MSGFEIAGVVLGAIPLVIAALEHYKANKGIAFTMVAWQGQVDKLIRRLNLQRNFFRCDVLELLRELGVGEAIAQPDMPEKECIRLLREVKAGAELEEYLGYSYGLFMDVLRRYEANLGAILSKLGHIHRLPDAAKDDLTALVAANVAQDGAFRFRERISFTIKRRALGEIVEELTLERLSLKDIIKSVKTQQEFAAREPSHEAKRLAGIFSQVQAGAKALFNAMCNGCTCRCLNAHTVMMRLDNRLPQKRERIKRKQVTIFNLIFTLEGSLQETLVKAPPTFEIDHSPQSHLTDPVASLGLVRLPTIQFIPPVGQYAQTIRVTDICSTAREARIRGCVLQLELTLHSLSFIEAPLERCQTFSAAASLETFLSEGLREEDARMTPKQRTILALDVAAAIPQLRETTWLKCPWDKRSIKFLVPQANQTTVGPFVEQIIDPGLLQSAGMGPSPKATLLELAILLLEIWHQRTLETWAASAGMQEMDSPETRHIAAIRWLERTSERLPVHHLTAVEQCLAICSGRLRAWDDGEFLKQYCENVIKPLQESCKAW